MNWVMKMTKKANPDDNAPGDITPGDTALDALFASAAQDTPDPSSELLARVLSDAETLAAARKTPVDVKPSKNWRPDFAALIAGIGGWPGIAGLTSVAVAGIWIGYDQTDTLIGLADGYLDTSTLYDLADFMPSVDDILGEG
jgi:hypothetical protein